MRASRPESAPRLRRVNSSALATLLLLGVVASVSACAQSAPPAPAASPPAAHPAQKPGAPASLSPPVTTPSAPVNNAAKPAAPPAAKPTAPAAAKPAAPAAVTHPATTTPAAAKPTAAPAGAVPATKMPAATPATTPAVKAPAPANASAPAKPAPHAAPAVPPMSSVKQPTPNMAGKSPTAMTPAVKPASSSSISPVVMPAKPMMKPGPPSTIPQIDEQVTYQYNALGRRDPFQSMVGGFVGDDVGGDAPPDVGGLKVVGIVWGASDKFALIEDGRGASGVLRPGDKVMNGVVQSLQRDAVVVKLTVDGQTETVSIPLTRKGDSNANR